MADKWTQLLHMEQPKGWLNDPNGLCFFDGSYHIYFQYTPDSPDGNGDRCWGHFKSHDMLNRVFTGTVLKPDTPDDKDGVYSGSAYPDGDMLRLFYTGNVREDGDHDYITSGRGANVICVTTKDGHHMSEKHTLMRNSYYPIYCSCHVRDPKIYREDGMYKMILGARTMSDEGCVLIYHSDNLENWKFEEMKTIADFGYMWECPDVFTLDGHKFLSISPQGVEAQPYRYQNVYQSGYFLADDNLISFTEWDYGFDFYAPQTFEAPDGRRIIIGWMGIGDAEYTNPTVELGRQHCLTLPREVTRDNDGLLCQTPIREIAALYRDEFTLSDNTEADFSLPFDLSALTNGSFEITLAAAVKISYNGSVLTLKFTDDEVGYGRTQRNAQLQGCDDIRIIADKSSLEIYAHHGKCVMSSRFYPNNEDGKISVSLKNLSAKIITLNEPEVKFIGK